MSALRTLAAAACLAAATAITPAMATTFTVGENDFAWASDLAGNGFQPFAVSAATNASFGMVKDAEMYVCFSLDSPELTALRSERLLAHVNKGETSKLVPNVPFACALAQ